jgi:endogenous inhibitor of DNA gyrase (YacG/DUF329 family)
MGKMLCPGQDTAFWRPGDIFEVACSECGREVEFFKDDVSRRCPGCGKRIQNPKLNLGCAQWCEHAKQCLGYDPKEVLQSEGDDTALVDRLVAARRAAQPGQDQEFSRAVNLLEAAKQLMRQQQDQQASPRVLLAAAVMYGLEAATAERLMKEAGLDPEATDQALETMAAAASDQAAGAEAQLLRQALAQLDS